MPLLSTFGAASARGFGNLSGIALPSDSLFNTVSFLSHFDGTNNGVNNVFDDSSSSNHTITANGNVTQGSFGPFARPDGQWAVAFDGSGDRLRTNAANLGVSTEAFTAEAWVFPSTDMDQYDIIACLFDSVHSGNNNQTWSIRAGTSNTIEMITISGSTQTILSAGTVNIGEWNHVAISRNGTTMYAALNGTVTSASCASSLNGHEYFYIGAADANGSASYFFNGFISNVRYEIGNALYTSSYTPPSSALTATTNTKLLTCQSNRFVDNSTSAHTITVSGNPAVSAFGPFLTSEVYNAGVNGASGYFDGTGDYLDVANSSDLVLGTDDFTIEAWAYPTTYDTGNANIIMQRVNGGSNNGWLLGISSGGLWQFSTGAAVIKRSTASAGMKEWTHLAAVRNGSSYNFFVNGVSVGTSTTMYNFTDTTTFQLGWQGSFAEFTGYVCDARVIKGTALYTSAFTPPTAPLTAVTNTKLLLNMADGQAIDSAAQNNLTLYGDAKISSTQSKFGDTSMYFDGTGDEATYSSTGFGTGDFTMEAWVYPQTQPQRYPAVYYVTNGSSDRVAVAFDHDSQPNKFRCNVAGTVLSPSGTNAVDQWYHTAVVRYQGVITFYLNGTSVGSTAYTHNVTPETSFLGGNSPRSSELAFKGFIDDFRVSKTARYTANFTPPTEPFEDKGQ